MFFKHAKENKYLVTDHVDFFCFFGNKTDAQEEAKAFAQAGFGMYIYKIDVIGGVPWVEPTVEWLD